MKRTGAWLISCLILLSLPSLVFGRQTSSVTGVVTDQSGGVIPGAEVRLTNPQTGFAQSTKTNELGVYLFVQLKPGTGYTLTFGADGFKTLSITDLALGVGVPETHNARLELGAISTAITVEAKGEEATLNTTDASIGNVIDTRRLVDLPVQIRNSPAALLSLEPGVVGNNVGTSAINLVGSVTGARADQGNITVDGIDANDQATGQAFATTGNAPIDSVQEFRTVSANPGAGEGRSSGAQIELVTKSGTNDFHGSLREFHRDKSTAANSFFNNKTGIPTPQLIRNQFGGSLGGPVVRDRLFFFFDYEGRRDAQGVAYARTVPLDIVRNGGLAYINSNAGCTSTSRLDTTPNCITILTPAQVAAFDPRTIGADAALLSFMNSRYPVANDLSGGDGVTTGLFRFNAPSHRSDNTYTARIDWLPSTNHRLFGRFNIARRVQTDTVNNVAAQFPGDPETAQIQVKDYAIAIGDTWNLNSRMVNQLTVGVSRSGLEFPSLFRPSFPDQWTFGPLSAPYADISYQNRYVPVPTIRDDFSWIHGKHNIEFGGMGKPIRSKSALTNDFNDVTLGLGGLTTALDSSLRPTDILADPNAVAAGQWDSMFTFLLGRFASVNTNFNYGLNGQAFAPGTGKTRDFAYNELELYLQDTWKARADLTLTYGVRWQYYGVPYEVNGFQAVNDVDFRNLFNIRQQNAVAGTSGPTAEPLLRYDLGGKANDARGYSSPDLNNFAPRLSFAYNPSFKDGILGKMLGDRKTVFRAGGSILYDRIAGGITFIQDQVSYLFDNTKSTFYGSTQPATALANDPRFTGIGSLPVQNIAPVITRPSTPFVDSNGIPVGNATGEFNYAVDQNFRTPYSYGYSFGVQRELPGNFLLEVSYVGRLGRRLFSQADASQALNFLDPNSGQRLFPAFNALQAQIQAGDTGPQIVAQPWFENQISAALGASCTSVFNVSCTRVVRSFFGTLVRRGDLSDTLQALFGNGLLNPNVGLSAQFSTNSYITNLASSTYNGMLVSLRKRYSRNLQFDFNYTFSHSIDNQSSVVNTVAGGLICDLTNLRTCRGNSDFDVTHLVNVNAIYDIPLGKGHWMLGGVPGWLNEAVGGWEVGGIFTGRTGLPFSTTTDAYPLGFNFNSPAVMTGNAAALSGNPHDVGTAIQYFPDTTAALSVLRNPHAGEIGNRNTLRGPGFWDVDLSVLKNFRMPWSEKHRLQFRWESFNLLNHNSFGLPNANIRSSTFGRIISSASAPREMQFALRYDF